MPCRRGCLTSWLLLGRIRSAFRIRPKCCFSFCAAAKSTDCRVASLLAMTSINLPRVCIIWGHCRGAAGKRPCTRAHLPVFSMSLRTTSLQPRTRPSFCMSLRGAGQPPRDVAIRVPAEMPSKLAAVRANSLRLTDLPGRIAFRYVLPQENGLSRRSAPRNDMQQLSACSRCKDALPEQIRTTSPPQTPAQAGKYFSA